MRRNREGTDSRVEVVARHRHVGHVPVVCLTTLFHHRELIGRHDKPSPHVLNQACSLGNCDQALVIDLHLGLIFPSFRTLRVLHLHVVRDGVAHPPVKTKPKLCRLQHTFHKRCVGAFLDGDRRLPVEDRSLDDAFLFPGGQ